MPGHLLRVYVHTFQLQVRALPGEFSHRIAYRTAIVGVYYGVGGYGVDKRVDSFCREYGENPVAYWLADELRVDIPARCAVPHRGSGKSDERNGGKSVAEQPVDGGRRARRGHAYHDALPRQLRYDRGRPLRNL